MLLIQKGKSCIIRILKRKAHVRSLKHYRKVPKFWDTRNLFGNLPKIQANRQNHRVFCPYDANGIANSEDSDQTAPLGRV